MIVGEPECSESSQPALFVESHRLAGSAEIVTRPTFDFADDDDVASCDDQIDLARPTAPVADHQLVAMCEIPLQSKVLTR